LTDAESYLSTFVMCCVNTVVYDTLFMDCKTLHCVDFYVKNKWAWSKLFLPFISSYSYSGKLVQAH